LAERAAIVTGASAGIGLATTALLARRGFAVTMAARKRERLEEAAGCLRAQGAEVATTSVDAGDESGVSALVQDHLARYGRLDVVVANAGTGRPGGVARTTAADLTRMMRLNLEGPFFLARESLPALRHAGSEHHQAWFVVVASITGAWPMPGFAAYSASKAAAVSLARSITAEESAGGVRGCALCPAFVATAISEWARETIPASAMLTPEDVAEGVGFLLRLSANVTLTEIVMGRVNAAVHAP
jgi:NADP-dependent 3-hydroxy acid dehydrogenase YdfG